MKIETTSGHVIEADDADYPLLGGYSWYVIKCRGRLYAQARVPRTGKRVSMHRLLMQPPPRLVVHHKDNNGLNNRRRNLEVTTNQRNVQYVYEGKETGVYFNKHTGKWRTRLRGPDRKLVSLGNHATREAALAAVNKFKAERMN
jgi:HNH endonuclease